MSRITKRSSKKRRGGAIAIQAGMLLLAMLGAAACAVDVGWVVMTRTQLQAVSDSGALAAGTAIVAGLARRTSAATVIDAAARSYAQTYANSNRNGEQTSSYLNTTRDVTLGWAIFNSGTGQWDKHFGSQLPNRTGYNMVRVNSLRNQTGSTLGDRPIPLILGPILGQKYSRITATATAVAMPASNIRIESNTSITANIIPFAYNYKHWKKLMWAQMYYDANSNQKPSPPDKVQVDMDNLDKGWYVPQTGMWYTSGGTGVAGAKPVNPQPLFGHNIITIKSNGQLQTTYVEDYSDDYKVDGTTVSNGNDRRLEAVLYPTDTYSAGNFGTIDLGSPGNSTAEVQRQISTGLNDYDLSFYPNNTLTLPITTGGDTGISAGFKADLLAIKGQCRAIPLYSGVVIGTGNNATYNLTGWAGIRIIDVTLTGSSKEVTIEPCFMVVSGASGNLTGTIDYTTSAFAPLILIE